MSSTRAAALRAAVLLGLAASCGCGQRASGFSGGTDASSAMDVMVDATAPPSLLDGTSGGPPANCKNLQCKEVVCANRHSTTITGTALAPTVVGPDPLYNAI